MENIFNWVRDSIGINVDTQVKIITSVIVVAVLLIIRFLVKLLLFKKYKEVQQKYKIKKFSAYIVFVIALVIVSRVWFAGTEMIITYLGLLSAGLAIALKDPLVNLAGWLFIVLRKPFEVGDRIQVGSHSGDVIDLRIFQFTLMEIGNWVDADQSTGRVIHIPNGVVFTEPQANYSKGFQYIWNEIPVLLTFESNWQKAKQILLVTGNKHAEHLTEAAEKKVMEASRKFLIFYSKLTPIVFTSVKDSGVLLTIRYLCEPRKRRISQELIWEDILTEFSRCNDIDFAYPTQRFYDNLVEGKEGKSKRTKKRK